MFRSLTAAVLALAAPALASPAAAQLANPSAASLGLGGNYTAAARGFSAIAWNPAALGLPGTPGFSVAVLPVHGIGGLDPITLGDISEFEGQFVPNDVRERWLELIRQEGSQEGFGGVDLTYLALNIGRVGLQFGSSTNATADVAPDAAELILFGNSGLAGEPRDYSLAGSTFDAVATTTAALSYAQPLNLTLGALPDQRFSLGVTVKYTVGHALVHASDQGTSVSDDPLRISVDFPVVQTDTGFTDFDNGSGIGLDVGAAWQGGPWNAALAVQNVVSTFEWNADELFFRPGTALFTADTTDTDFTARAIAEGPAELVEFLEERTYKPTLVAGATFRPLQKLMVSADVRYRLDDVSADLGPQMHAGVGVEFRPIGILPLRLGAAAISDGYLVGGGLGIEVGVFNLNVSAGQRETDRGRDAIGMLTLSFGAR